MRPARLALVLGTLAATELSAWPLWCDDVPTTKKFPLTPSIRVVSASDDPCLPMVGSSRRQRIQSLKDRVNALKSSLENPPPPPPPPVPAPPAVVDEEPPLLVEPVVIVQETPAAKEPAKEPEKEPAPPVSPPPVDPPVTPPVSEDLEPIPAPQPVAVPEPIPVPVPEPPPEPMADPVPEMPPAPEPIPELQPAPEPQLQPAPDPVLQPAPPPMIETPAPPPVPEPMPAAPAPAKPIPVPPAIAAPGHESSPLTLPTELLDQSIDRARMGNNLYAIGAYELALMNYEMMLQKPLSSAESQWVHFQVGNCQRHLGKVAEAQKAYRHVAGETSEEWLGQMSRWWLKELDDRAQLQGRVAELDQVISALKQELKSAP